MVSSIPQGEEANPRGAKIPTKAPQALSGSQSNVSSEVNEKTTPESSEEQVEYIPPVKMGKLRWFSVCLGMYLTAFLYGLDSTIAADVQGPILAALGDLNLLPWVGTGFLLGSVATISLFGSLYAKVEVKWLYLASILAFEVGSAICGAAPNMKAMAVGRVIAGVGGAGIFLGGLTYIAIFVSPGKRPFYTALISTFWGLGCVLGPVVGGGFAQSKATWRWSFYINLVLAGLTAPIYIFCFPQHGVHEKEKLVSQIKTLDWLGALLNAAAYALFITACTYSGSPWRWSSGPVITLWIMTGLTVLLFVVQQWTAFMTTKEDRIFPVWCLQTRSLVTLYLGTAGSSAVMNCNLYYLPLFFEFTREDSAIKVASRLLPFIFFMIFGGLSTGALLPRLNLYAAWYVFSGSLALVGSSLLFCITTSTPNARIYGLQVLVGLGCGLTFQAAYSIALVKAPAHRSSSALGFINIAQLGGGALALAVAGSVFQNTGFNSLEAALDGRGYSSDEIRAALGGGYSSIINDSTSEVRKLALNAIGKTIAKVYGVSISGAAVALVAGVVMRWERVKMA